MGHRQAEDLAAQGWSLARLARQARSAAGDRHAIGDRQQGPPLRQGQAPQDG